jgi:L-ascorbate metabolism protein UlaG (beta-lactamase superfamily)
MKVRWLGWAGVEIEAEGETVLIDPLADPAATFAALAEDARERMQVPEVTAPTGAGALAGLVSHLHRDHTDADALLEGLAADAAVYEPVWPGGEDSENLSLAQANFELERADLERRAFDVWDSAEIGPFAVTALPAVDGLGDPQVSWLVEAGGHRVLHLGDTIFHGYWWRMVRRHGPFDVVLAPINGAVTNFPNLQPPSSLAAAMEPEQAALAAQLLQARILVPIHYGGFHADPWYLPIEDARERFEAAAAGHPYEARVLEPGESFESAAAPLGA